MDLVVKDNSLINASYTLSLVEQRLILLAIIEARESGKGINTETFLEIHAQHYADRFEIQLNNAYALLSEATQTLFNRQVTYTAIDEKRNKVEKRVVRWVSGISYVEGAGIIKLRFAPEVVPLITRLEKNFTSYELEQVKNLNGHATRLYEILISWRSIGKINIGLDDLRQSLGLTSEYVRVEAFKRRVLDVSIEQINKHTDITVSYEQQKQGRTITSFAFKFKQKAKVIRDQKDERDPNTADLFIQYTDKQLARVVHSKKFIADYNGLVSAQNPANQSSAAWISHMVEWIKREPNNFTKRSFQEYLNDEQAARF